jgi:hypothetical protein
MGEVVVLVCVPRSVSFLRDLAAFAGILAH